MLYIGLHALYKCTGSLTWPQLASSPGPWLLVGARLGGADCFMTVCALGPHSFNVGGVMYIFAVCCECGAGECGAGFSRVNQRCVR